MGELDSKCHQEVKKFINIRVEFGVGIWNIQSFILSRLTKREGIQHVRQFLKIRTLILGHYVVLSMQEHASYLPASFSFYRMYNVTSENNLVAFRCVQIISQDHVVHDGKKGLSGSVTVCTHKAQICEFSGTSAEHSRMLRDTSVSI